MLSRSHSLPVEVRSLGILLIVMLLARFGLDPMPRQVPFLPILNSFGTDAQWISACKLIFIAGSALVLSGIAVQTGCLLAGLCLVMKVLGNMPLFSNGRLFDGLVLVLIGLYVPGKGLTFLRVQCYLLYMGAVLSKFIDADWWDGRFIYAMLEYHLREPQLGWFAPFATVGGWLTMATESACAVLLMTSRWRWAGVLTVATFHTTLLVVLSEDFGTFYYTVALCAVLLFVELPFVELVTLPNTKLNFLVRRSIFSSISTAVVKTGAPLVRFSSTAYEGANAILLLILTNLPCQALLMGSAAFLSRRGYARLRDALLAAAVLTAICLLIAGRKRPPPRYTESLSKSTV